MSSFTNQGLKVLMRRGGRNLAIPILSHDFNEEHACVLHVIRTFSLRKHTCYSFEALKKRQIVLFLIICNTIVICNKICIKFISLSKPHALPGTVLFVVTLKLGRFH